MGGILALASPTSWLGSTQEVTKHLPDFHRLAAQATSHRLAAVTEAIEAMYSRRGE
jgi:hypothetical protein